MQWEINQEIDIKHGAHGVQVWPNALMITGDNEAHAWRIKLLEEGRAAIVSGSVTAYFVRPDNSTVMVAGALTDNLASVSLPQAVYAQEGMLQAIMRLTAPGGGVTTLSALMLPVRRVLTDTVIDPGSVIPSLDDLLAQIEAMEEATENANAATLAANNAETARAQAEGGRVTAEGARAQAETARGQAETARATAEGTRGTAETARAQAETARGQAETARATAEGQRVNAEDARVLAEGRREQDVLAAIEDAEEATEAARDAATEANRYNNRIAAAEEDIRRIDWKTGVKKYIIRWNRVTAQCERMGDAAGITTTITNFAHRGSVNANYSNPFDGLYPWSHRRLCKVDRAAYQNIHTVGGDIMGAIVAWEGEPGFALGGDLADMVYTPTFWCATWEDENYVYIGVADGDVQGWTKRPATIGGRYHASMDAEGKLTSRAGDIAARGIAISTLHSNAKSQNMTLDDIYTWCDDSVLMAVEYATLNTQAAVGDGVSSVYRETDTDLCQLAETAANRVILPNAFKASAIPGSVLDIGTGKGTLNVASRVVVSAADYGDGSLCEVIFAGAPVNTLLTHYCAIHGISNTPDAAIGSMSGYLGANTKCIAYYRGRIAHGNYWRYVLGAYRQKDTGKIWIATDRHQANAYDALNTGVHIDTGKVLPQNAEGAAKEGYLSALHFVPSCPLAPFGAETGGNSANPVGDYLYAPALTSGNTILLAGARASDGARVGRFCGYWNYSAGNSYWNVAALLFLLPPEGV